MNEGLTRSHLAQVAATVLAAAAGVMTAVAISSSAAATQAVTTLGNTTGTPNANISCPMASTPGASAGCTYVPFSSPGSLSSLGSPELQVPFNGTVTGFSITSGSAGGTVTLRVLRPAGGGQFTALASSAPATLAVNGNTFTTSLPVQAGDLIGLDNDTSALIFDNSSSVPGTAYYQPALVDGQMGAPNQVATGTRLLLSATVQAAATSTTTATTSGTTTAGSTTTSPTTFTSTTPPVVPPSHRRPRLSGVHQSHATWSEPSKAGHASGPVGTTFSFQLNEGAQVHLSFDATLPGRRAGSRCVASTAANRALRACTRSLPRGSLNPHGQSGANHVAFQGRLAGRMLAPGHYTLVITAASGGRSSGVARLTFRILAPT